MAKLRVDHLFTGSECLIQDKTCKEISNERRLKPMSQKYTFEFHVDLRVILLQNPLNGQQISIGARLMQ